MPVAAADVDFPLVSDHGTTETGLKHRGNLCPFVFIWLIPAIAISLSSHLEGLWSCLPLLKVAWGLFQEIKIESMNWYV